MNVLDAIFEDRSGAVLWGLGDQEGTIRDIVNNSRTVVDHRKYDSFGNITSESAPATDFIFGYTGQALDEATGLMDYGHRWYDAAVGRFASEDPSGFDAGDMNLYRYVNNNPLNNTDPTGLCGIHSTFESYPGASALLSSVGSSYNVASSGVSYDLFGNPIQRYGSSSSSSHSAATIGGSTGLSSTFKSPVVSSPISSSLASYSGATSSSIPGVSGFTLTSGAVTQGSIAASQNSSGASVGKAVAFYDAWDTTGVDGSGIANWKDLKAASQEVADSGYALPVFDTRNRPEMGGNARSPVEQATLQLDKIVAAGNRVDKVYISDHGYSMSQQFGSKDIDPNLKTSSGKAWQALGQRVDTNGVIVLGGCQVGSNVSVVQKYAETAGRTVRASQGVAAGWDTSSKSTGALWVEADPVNRTIKYYKSGTSTVPVRVEKWK